MIWTDIAGASEIIFLKELSNLLKIALDQELLVINKEEKFCRYLKIRTIRDSLNLIKSRFAFSRC